MRAPPRLINRWHTFVIAAEVGAVHLRWVCVAIATEALRIRAAPSATPARHRLIAELLQPRPHLPRDLRQRGRQISRLPLVRRDVEKLGAIVAPEDNDLQRSHPERPAKAGCRFDTRIVVMQELFVRRAAALCNHAPYVQAVEFRPRRNITSRQRHNRRKPIDLRCDLSADLPCRHTSAQDIGRYTQAAFPELVLVPAEGKIPIEPTLIGRRAVVAAHNHNTILCKPCSLPGVAHVSNRLIHQ